MDIAPVRRGRLRSNYAAAQSRSAAHGARRYEQQAGCVGAPGKAPAENVRRRSSPQVSQPGCECSGSHGTVTVRRADSVHTGPQNAMRRARNV